MLEQVLSELEVGDALVGAAPADFILPRTPSGGSRRSSVNPQGQEFVDGPWVLYFGSESYLYQ